jgi:hypothetical protein
MRTALEPDEQLERIALLLPGGAEDTRHDFLRGRALRGAIAAADLAGDDGRPDGLFGLPVGRLDTGAAQAREERGTLGAQVLEEATVRRMGDAAGKEAVGARLEAADGDGQAMPRERARVPAIADRQGRQEQAAHGVREAGRAARGGLQEAVTAAQQVGAMPMSA